MLFGLFKHKPVLHKLADLEFLYHSYHLFDTRNQRKGWNITDKHFNVLEGNSRLEDRGSIYFLIQKNS